MRKMFKSIIIICILILNILIINWDFDSNAKNLDDEITNTTIPRSDGHPRGGNFDWGEIEVISEPIVNQNINNAPSYEPKIAIENDKIYMVWGDATNINGAGTDIDIFYRHYNGNQWSEIQIISEPLQGDNKNIDICGSPDIAVENGKIYVIWEDYNNTDGAGLDPDIFYRCNLSGSNWEDIQVISEPVVGKNFNIRNSQVPRITVENGKIYVVWFDENNTNGAGTDNDIFYRCNLTTSEWEDIQVISEPIFSKDYNTMVSSHPEIAVENGKVYVVWGDGNGTNGAGSDLDVFYRCNLTGFGWEDIQVISEPIPGDNSNTGDSHFSVIAVENGKIYIVWVDDNNTNGAGTDTDIFYRCSLTGSSWEPIQVISESISSQDLNIEDSWYPAIAVEYNKIYVVWSDKNSTNGAGIDKDIFYKCNLTGSGWEPVQVISESIAGFDINTFASDGPDIEVNHGKSYIVWQDKNNTNGAGTDWDIFYRYLNLPLILSKPSVTPTSGSSGTEYKFTVTYTHLINLPPTKITVNISGTEYPLLDVDPDDTNYMDGKNYYFNINNLDIRVHSYQFYASDSEFSWSTAHVNRLQVHNTPPNITTENNPTAFEDIYYEVNYEYKDIDVINVNQPVSWNFSTDAEWLTFNNFTALLYGTPINDDVDEYWVNITINDTIDFNFTNFTLTVINVNDAPIIITNDTNIINEDEFYEVDYEAFDADTLQKNLNWFMSTNASWLGFNQESATLSGLPENNDVGEFWVNISISDGEYIDFSNFTLKVINVNDPPKIITKEIAMAYEDKYYEMDFKAEDVDNPQSDLTWTISTNAQWLRVDNINSIINGTPLNDDVGEYWVNLSVTDGKYIDDRNITLNIMNTNDPPKIIVKDKTIAIVGELYSVNYDVIDIDPPPNSFIWSIQTNTSDWLSIGPNTGLLIGEPSEKDIGNYWANISVTDGEGGWDYYNFTLEVLKSPAPEKDTSDTPFISTETFYWAIWIIIIIIILIALMILLTLKKQKKEVIQIIREQRNEVIQTVKAELLAITPSHISLPTEASPEGKMTLPAQPVVIDQLLPKTVDQTQSATTAEIEDQPVKAIGITPLPQQYQLPKATHTKAQKLDLLQERFLRGEVSEGTYNKLRSEIDTTTGEEIIEEEIEQQTEPIEEPTNEEAFLISTPKHEPIGKSLQQLTMESEPIAPQTQPEASETKVQQAEQPLEELHPTPEVKVQQPQTPQQQLSTQVQQKPRPIKKGENDEEQTT